MTKRKSDFTLPTLDDLFSSQAERDDAKLKRDEISKFFPSSYTDEQIRRDIVKELELLKRQRERSRDAR